MWRNLEWSDGAREHIARHRITPEEVELAVWSESYVRRIPGEFSLIGEAKGRVLFVVLRRSTLVPGAVEPVTARDATWGEKHLWARRKRLRR